jgi:methyl-accepting chemotaxis protein
MAGKNIKAGTAVKRGSGKRVASRKITIEASILEELRGQIAALSKSQAKIEFDPDGTVRSANDNFLQLFGYSLEEIVGKNHSELVEPAHRDSAEYRAFWAKLRGGAFEAGRFKRFGKGGSEIWVRANYNPILDTEGRLLGIVTYAADIRPQILREADLDGQISAISKAQAVIEFELDGTIRTANDNFLRAVGYSLQEIKGQKHSLFVTPEQRDSAEYRALWEKLRRGEYDAGQYRCIGKDGKELWIQATYNPIADGHGIPFKIIEYATDITSQVTLSLQLRKAVEQTQAAVKSAIQGDLTARLPLEGKTGLLEALCRGVNELLSTVGGLVADIDAVVERAQQQDLTARIKLGGKTGAFEKLSTGINVLIDQMMTVVQTIRSAAEKVTTGTQEIASGNSNLSKRTEEQAASLEETASSMEEMTATVRQTAENAGQANQLAIAARQQAENGGVVVNAAIASMAGINVASGKIAAIISVIDEIAFQTNLLALNAAVEAARAGEQGRGFAVVATEVRNLAGRSATAAKEIKALIRDSVSKVEQGSKLVNESGTVLEEIVAAVEKVTDIVAQIAAASREQSTGIEQVNRAVMQMDSNTQQNAALVEQAAAASQAIVEQTQALNETISRYTIAAHADSLLSASNGPASGRAQASPGHRPARTWSPVSSHATNKTASARGTEAAPDANVSRRRVANAPAGTDGEWSEF